VTHIKSGSLLVGICLTLAGASGTAFAYDEYATGSSNIKYSGVACVGDGQWSDNTLFTVFGRIYNESTATTRDFICPLMRFNDFYDNAPVQLSAKIYVDDQSSTENVSCRVYSCNTWGDDCYVGSIVSSSGTGLQTINLGTISAYGLTGSDYIICSVPKKSSTRSGITAYYGTLIN